MLFDRIATEGKSAILLYPSAIKLVSCIKELMERVSFSYMGQVSTDENI